MKLDPCSPFSERLRITDPTEKTKVNPEAKPRHHSPALGLWWAYCCWPQYVIGSSRKCKTSDARPQPISLAPREASTTARRDVRPPNLVATVTNNLNSTRGVGDGHARGDAECDLQSKRDPSSSLRPAPPLATAPRLGHERARHTEKPRPPSPDAHKGLRREAGRLLDRASGRPLWT